MLALLSLLFFGSAAAFGTAGPTTGNLLKIGFTIVGQPCSEELTGTILFKIAHSVTVLPMSHLKASCGAEVSRRLAEASSTETSAREEAQASVTITATISKEEQEAALRAFFAPVNRAVVVAAFQAQLQNVQIDGLIVDGSCSVWQPQLCGLTPWGIRDQCSDQSYNPTVGVDSLAGTTKVTNTFPVAPGLATKNSAVNFLKGTGYDPEGFGRDILKYTYNSNKLWSVGERNYALPDTVSVYTANVACSLEKQTMTTGVASSADYASSESSSKSASYSKSFGKGPAAQSASVGFGRSRGNGEYESNAQAGRTEATKYSARAVSYTATIATEPLTSCDMNEFFVTDVLRLALCIEKDGAHPLCDQLKQVAGLETKEDLIDWFINRYGTHLPVKFELGCEVSRTFNYASTMSSTAKETSETKTQDAGFSMFGFGAKTESSSSEETSTAASSSGDESRGATQISCGKPGPELKDFCDSVVMNTDQSHLPKMLRVEGLRGIWRVMSQVDPWIGPDPENDQSNPLVSKDAIVRSALQVEKRFEDLTTSGDESLCNTAGELDPPSESGMCTYTGLQWDCSKCTCYNVGFDPSSPNAAPSSSCTRTACQPLVLTDQMQPPGDKARTQYEYYTLDQCHKQCLRYPMGTGVECYGFWFKAYDAGTFAGGQCWVYSQAFTKKDVATSWTAATDGAYYQYESGKNGCNAGYNPSQEIEGGYCAPGTSHMWDDWGNTEDGCFSRCQQNKYCVGVVFNQGSRCTGFDKDNCKTIAYASDGRKLKAFCQRAMEVDAENSVRDACASYA